MLELIGAGAGGASVVATGSCAGTFAGLLASTGPLGRAATGPDGRIGTRFGVGERGTALIVPIAEDTATCVDVGAATGCSAGAEDEGDAAAGGGGGGGGEDSAGASTALDCTGGACAGGACAAGVVAVTSVGVTTAGSCEVTIEEARVRARERVHRFPLTVVIDSCGVAMQTTGS